MTIRISGVHDELIKAGAFMGFHAGWEQPDWYTVDGSKPEYKPSFYRYFIVLHRKINGTHFKMVFTGQITTTQFSMNMSLLQTRWGLLT